VVHADAVEAVAAFEREFYARLTSDPEFRRLTLALRGRRLGCWCSPAICHAEVIAIFLDCYADDAA
jgi:hypothetical protein